MLEDDNTIKQEVKIESIVSEGEIRNTVPIIDAETRERAGKYTNIPVPVPWEFMLRKIHEDFYNGDWMPNLCCPRCLDYFPLPHGCEISGNGETISTDLDRDKQVPDAEYIYAENTVVTSILEADSPEVTIHPSIGCPTCGFHCHLKSNEFSISSDWSGASGNGERAYHKKMMHIRYSREEEHERMLNIGYPKSDIE